MPSAESTRLLAAVDRDEVVGLTRQLVRIKSYTGSSGEARPPASSTIISGASTSRAS